MIKNYLKIGWRNLRRNKLYAVVNIVGLAIGITCCLLIGLYINQELSFDRFHKNADRIARVTWSYKFDDAVQKVALTGTRVGPEFARSFPEVESYARTFKYATVVRYGDRMFDEQRFLYADSGFFSIFSFPLIQGNAGSVLDAPDKLVITRSAARKYFGSEDPVGKTVQLGGAKDMVISGVAADVPGNSQIQFDFVAPFRFLNASKTEKWNEANYITYLLLKNPGQFSSLQAKIDQYAKTTLRKELQLEGNNYSNFELEPITKVHLHSTLEGFEPNTNIKYIYILAAVALLILLVACVNYTNLSTAQSARRSAEVGMRKVMGAGRMEIFRQFISESFLLVLLAMVLAVAATYILLPYFNQLAGKQLNAAALLDPVFIMGVFVFLVFISFAAGTYPSFILSGGKVIHILKSGFQFTGSGHLRKSLIVFQFVISIFLIVSTVIILQQLSYINHKDLGYDKEQVIVLPADRKMQANYDDLKAAMANHPSIISVGGAYEEPTDIGWSDGLHTGAGGSGPSLSVNALPVDVDFNKTLGLTLIAGSDYNLTDERQLDTTDDNSHLCYSYMLNETAVKALGWTPEQAIGKTITKGVEGEVKAVVKDFHFRSLHEAIGPLLIFMDKRMVNRFFVKIKGNIPAALDHLKQVWTQRISHRPFEFHFLDEDYDALYKTETKTAGVFSAFATIAILLACLGLFALTAFSMVQRTKEIGIRKILGATVPDILRLVSKDFLQLVCIAFIIAIPLSWFMVHKWLENFVYKINVEWWVFAGAGLATLLIAFLTISLQAMKTAVTNPVKNLRTE